MSLTKLLRLHIFKKNVISFLVIRRHDLGILQENLKYLSVRENASVSTLRSKVWHLLNLPDYCDEIIVLKNCEDLEIPLQSLTKGNDPQHPFVLEVYLPEGLNKYLTMIAPKMLTMGENEGKGDDKPSEIKTPNAATNVNVKAQETLKTKSMNEKGSMNKFFEANYNRSELSFGLSRTSVNILNVNSKKSRDNFTTVLLKIQQDLSVLSTKLSNLENRIM